MTVPPDHLPPRPGLLGAVLGAARVAVTLALLAGGAVAVLAASAMPPRRGAPRPALRVAGALSRACLWVAGVRREGAGLDRLRGHRGFVFFNHVSYLDPLVLAAAAPMRFLAAAGVRRLPLIGPMAAALGTVFVHRGRGESRRDARGALLRAVTESPEPVAVAPEGRIGPGGGVLPFRHGAFEVAQEARAEVLLVALRFSPHRYALWQDGEWLVAAYWRLCARTEPVTATLAVLDALGPVERPAEAAGRAEREVGRWLGRAGAAHDLGAGRLQGQEIL